jgi:hemerythrin-like metal-binding protein
LAEPARALFTSQRQPAQECIPMDRLTWTEDLNTGNPLLDGDHRQLTAFVNALFEAMEEPPPNSAIGKAMSNLIAYTKEHFGREEAEMERVQYVASLAHRSEHANLTRQMAELKAILDSGGNINMPAVSTFLREWLHHHIVTADRKLAAALERETQAH